jgi:hypothetical protein
VALSFNTQSPFPELDRDTVDITERYNLIEGDHQQSQIRSDESFELTFPDEQFPACWRLYSLPF